MTETDESERERVLLHAISDLKAVMDKLTVWHREFVDVNALEMQMQEQVKRLSDFHHKEEQKIFSIQEDVEQILSTVKLILRYLEQIYSSGIKKLGDGNNQ